MIGIIALFSFSMDLLFLTAEKKKFKKGGITNSQPLDTGSFWVLRTSCQSFFLPFLPRRLSRSFPACKSEVFLISSSFFNLFIHQVPHFFPVTSSKYTADLWPHLWPLSQGSPGLTSSSVISCSSHEFNSAIF